MSPEYVDELTASLALLDKAADTLLDNAEHLKKQFWNDVTSGGEKAHYTVSISRENSSVRIRWARLKPLKTNNGIRVVPKHLPVASYTDKSFRAAGSRERQIIVMYETQLKPLREELRQNRAIRKLLSRRITENRKFLNLTNMRDEK